MASFVTSASCTISFAPAYGTWGAGPALPTFATTYLTYDQNNGQTSSSVKCNWASVSASYNTAAASYAGASFTVNSGCTLLAVLKDGPPGAGGSMSPVTATYPNTILDLGRVFYSCPSVYTTPTQCQTLTASKEIVYAGTVSYLSQRGAWYLPQLSSFVQYAPISTCVINFGTSPHSLPNAPGGLFQTAVIAKSGAASSTSPSITTTPSSGPASSSSVPMVVPAAASPSQAPITTTTPVPGSSSSRPASSSSGLIVGSASSSAAAAPVSSASMPAGLSFGGQSVSASQAVAGPVTTPAGGAPASTAESGSAAGPASTTTSRAAGDMVRASSWWDIMVVLSGLIAGLI